MTDWAERLAKHAQILETDGTHAAGGGASDLDDLTDVDTTTSPPSTGQALVWDGDAWVPGNVAAGGGSGPDPSVGALAFLIDGAGSVISTGVKGDIEIPYDCEITGWSLLADVSGSMVVDLWSDTYGNYPPVVGDSITAADKPTISSALKAQDTAPTGWASTVTAGDTIRVNVDSCSTITRATLTLYVTKSITPATLGVALAFVIDGCGSAITTGLKGDLDIPFDCTLTGWSLLADVSGSIVVDIWKDSYANYPPVVGDSITASDKPTLSSAVKAQDLAPTGWTTAVTAGNTLRFNVDSASTVTRVTITLYATRSVAGLLAGGGGGGASALEDLTDVDVTTTPPDDQQALIWDATSSLWIPGDVAAGGGGGGMTQAYVGKDAIGASTENMTGTRMYMKQVVLAEDCLLTDVEAYMNHGASGSWNLSAMVFSDNAGVPDDLLSVAKAEEVVWSGPRWLGIPIGRWLPAGTYWIGFAMLIRAVGSGDIALAYDTGGSDRYHDTGYSQQVSDATPTTDSTRSYSIRANTMVPSAGGGGGGGVTQAYAGYDTAGTSWETPAVNSKIYLKQITLSDDTFIASIGAYVRTASTAGAGGLSVGLLTDNAGAPGILIAHGPSSTGPQYYLTGTTPRWIDAPLGAWVTAGTYWLAIRDSDVGYTVLLQLAYDGSGTDRTATGNANQWADWAHWASPATTSNKYSIRANTLTPSAGGGGSSSLPAGVVLLMEAEAVPHADDDEGTGADTDPVAGWTTMGTVTTFDRDTTIPGALYFALPADGATKIDGAYKAHTMIDGEAVVARLDGHTFRANYNRGGIFIGVASPGRIDTMNYLYNGGSMQWEALAFNSPASFSGSIGNATIGVISPIYLAIRRNSATSYDFLYGVATTLGIVWTQVVTARNPGFTQATCGIFASSQSGNTVKAAFGWMRFFPTLPAAIPL